MNQSLRSFFFPTPFNEIRPKSDVRYSNLYSNRAKHVYTPFQNNDVLFAKITPCMENGKTALARDLVGGYGFGSTEFHVLRAKDGVLPEWLHFFVRQAIESILNQQAGAIEKAQATFNALLAQAFSPPTSSASTQE